jgi:Flp pilus assembly CpaE family ATPase
MHQARCIVGTLAEGGYQQNRIRLVVNRTPARLDVTPVQLEQCLGRPIDYFISNDYPELYHAYAEGNLLDRDTSLGKQFSRFAASLSAPR